MDNETGIVTDTGERVILAARRHWAVLIPPFFLLIFAGLSIPSKGTQAWVIVFISLAWIVVSWMNYQAAWFRLTKERLLIKPGFPWPKTHDMPLDTIRTVTVYQPVLGKFLDFGKLRITRSDGSRKFFKMVGSPHLLTSAIYDLKAAQEAAREVKEETGKDAGTTE